MTSLSRDLESSCAYRELSVRVCSAASCKHPYWKLEEASLSDCVCPGPWRTSGEPPTTKAVGPRGDQVSTGVRSSLQLWDGCRVTFDRAVLTAESIPVKGCASPNPLRFLEIFADTGDVPVSLPEWPVGRDMGDLTATSYSAHPGRKLLIGPGHLQPPYRWGDSYPYYICRSFTYNTNGALPHPPRPPRPRPRPPRAAHRHVGQGVSPSEPALQVERWRSDEGYQQ